MCWREFEYEVQHKPGKENCPPDALSRDPPREEHRFEPDLPLYMAVERAGLELHLSEHHGDGTPGSTSYVAMRDIAKFHAELISRKYGYGRPNLERQPWGDQMEVSDPFGNRIRFCQESD